MFSVGDARVEFSIQSVSKPFVFALVCDAIGHDVAQEKLGVNSTGLPFNSVMAIELSEDRTLNPMVNAGAIATTSLVPGATSEDRWQFVLEGLSRFAGRELVLDREVYDSEAATNLRNQGIAHLMDSYGRVYSDPDDATDTYTKQCSLLVTAEDLAVMGATLADGGVNPVTRRRVVDAATCTRVLAVLATAGLYELTGDWLYEVGLPGKSGRQRRHRHHRARQGRPRHLVAAARRGRQQRARPAAHPARLRGARAQPVRLGAVGRTARTDRHPRPERSGRSGTARHQGVGQAGSQLPWNPKGTRRGSCTVATGPAAMSVAASTCTSERSVARS